MALIKCQECGKEISTTAENCPYCGWRTRHGRSVTTAKFHVVLFVIAAIAVLAGLVKLINNLGDFLDLLYDWNQVSDSSYWRNITFMEYVDYREDEEVLQNTLVAAGLMAGGIIALAAIKKSGEEDDGNGFVREMREEKERLDNVMYRKRNPQPHSSVKKSEVQAPKLDSAVKVICCPVCGKSQFSNAKLCFSCGAELGLPKQEKKFIFCQMCGTKQPYDNKNCTACGKELVKPKEKEPEYIFCHKCGQKQLAENKNCTACGTTLKK